MIPYLASLSFAMICRSAIEQHTLCAILGEIVLHDKYG